MTDSSLPAAAYSPHPDILREWLIDLTAELGLSPDDVDIAAVLDLAKVAAHSIARPAAPLTTFIVGLAAGRAGGSPVDIQAAIRVATALTTTDKK
jgi:hypothetical protein